ncbi:MAG: hypothetical protein ACWA41_10250 [Putridiphycobacter sp.]
MRGFPYLYLDLEIKNIQNKTILIAALDWGFGHTTRCVSIIKQLFEQSNHIIFAGNEKQIGFMALEFPELAFENLEGYQVTLSSGRSTYWQVIKQLRKIKASIRQENQWVKNYISKHKVDLIIADNRYGFRHNNILSIFMGHQLNVQIPSFKKVFNKVHTRLINKFDFCWIVDDKELNLAGELSHPNTLKIPYSYTGLLNRFDFHPSQEIIYDYLVIISGPHPENQNFLNAIQTHFIGQPELNIAVVTTLDGKKNQSSLTYYKTPTTQDLNVLIGQSKKVISKLGYTTLMEMVALNKSCVLLPTKGQYEQLYLADIINHESVETVRDITEIGNKKS